MRQIAPDPTALFELVVALEYKANWSFSLEDSDRGQGSEGLTLCILIDTPDSYHPTTKRRVMHFEYATDVDRRTSYLGEIKA